MTTRASNAASLAAGGLAALLLSGPLALPSHAQEPIRGIALFPGPETAGVVPKTEVSPQPESFYVAGAAMASVTVFAPWEGGCLVGEFLGFVVGSVLRVPVWAATLGDQLGSSEGLDRLGRFVVEKACVDSFVVTTADLKREPTTERPPAPSQDR